MLGRRGEKRESKWGTSSQCRRIDSPVLIKPKSAHITKLNAYFFQLSVVTNYISKVRLYKLYKLNDIGKFI